MKLKKIVLLLIVFSALFSYHHKAFGSSGVFPTENPAAPSDTFPVRPVDDAPLPDTVILKETAEDVSQSYTGLKVSGHLPVIEITREETKEEIREETGTEIKTEGFAGEINKAIRKLYNEKMQEAQRGRVSAIQFDYELKRDDEIISVLIKTAYTKGAVKNEIGTINFNVQQGRFLAITDILGPNGVDIANKIISETIKRNPEKYNPNYNDIMNSHSFYAEGRVVFIVFNENEIAAGSQGIVTFPIEINAIIDHVIPQSSYYTKDSYGLKMIPLRKVCEAFEYEVTWNDSLRTVDIVKDQAVTSFIIGANEYGKGEERRVLEAAPEITNGMTYVPISFFRDILGIACSTDEKGAVTFTVYEQK